MCRGSIEVLYTLWDKMYIGCQIVPIDNAKNGLQKASFCIQIGVNNIWYSVKARIQISFSIIQFDVF